MRKKLSKSNIIIAQKGISLVVVFATLLTAFVAIAPWTYGWFSKNDTVTVSGIHTQAYYAKFGVTYEINKLQIDETTGKPQLDQEGNPIYKYESFEFNNDTQMPNSLFSDIRAPGDSVEIRVTITNKKFNKYTVNLTGFGLEAPSTAQDVPKLDDEGKIRYLSTEITTQLLGVTVVYPSTNTNTPPDYTVKDYNKQDDETSSAPVQLRAGESKNPGSAERIDYIDAIDQTKVSVPVGGSVTFTIRLTFVNATYNQNIYKNFAETGGKCERTFFFTFEDEIP